MILELAYRLHMPINEVENMTQQQAAEWFAFFEIRNQIEAGKL